LVAAIRISLVVLLVIVAAGAIHAAPEGVVTATGEAAVEDTGGPAGARQQAIESACAGAVAQVAEALAAGDRDASVQGPPDAYIRHYRVLSEAREGDRYRVTIECAVAVEALRAVLANSPPPGEDTGGRRALSGAAGGALETVAMAVTGVRPLARFSRFRSALAAMSGVERVQTVEVSGTRATVQVAVRGGAAALAAALRQGRFDGFRVEVASWSDGRMAVTLRDGHLP
jgi:hypothetical protein